jgi:hypothetical protein
MPVQRCQEGGKSGWRWGKQGKCYIGGKEAKKKALKQGYAIDPEHFAEVAAESPDITTDEVYNALLEETQNMAVASMLTQEFQQAREEK